MQRDVGKSDWLFWDFSEIFWDLRNLRKYFNFSWKFSPPIPPPHPHTAELFKSSSTLIMHISNALQELPHMDIPLGSETTRPSSIAKSLRTEDQKKRQREYSSKHYEKTKKQRSLSIKPTGRSHRNSVLIIFRSLEWLRRSLESASSNTWLQRDWKRYYQFSLYPRYPKARGLKSNSKVQHETACH